VTGEPAGSNSVDVAFANNMIAGDQQGIDLSALVPDRSTNPEVVAFAAACTSTRQSDIATLRVLLVQWSESSKTPGDSEHGATQKGMVDQETVAKLHLLHGSEFDTLWLESMTGVDQGVIEMANAEVANGKNVDAVGLAEQILEVRRAEIGEIKRMLGD
jgi:uncharacterized protein (DUF305 family)